MIYSLMHVITWLKRSHSRKMQSIRCLNQYRHSRNVEGARHHSACCSHCMRSDYEEVLCPQHLQMLPCQHQATTSIVGCKCQWMLATGYAMVAQLPRCSGCIQRKIAIHCSSSTQRAVTYPSCIYNAAHTCKSVQCKLGFCLRRMVCSNYDQASMIMSAPACIHAIGLHSKDCSCDVTRLYSTPVLNS
jgi:hypothetical protein